VHAMLLVINIQPCSSLHLNDNKYPEVLLWERGPIMKVTPVNKAG